jgi:hypothetical protein
MADTAQATAMADTALISVIVVMLTRASTQMMASATNLHIAQSGLTQPIAPAEAAVMMTRAVGQMMASATNLHIARTELMHLIAAGVGSTS